MTSSSSPEPGPEFKLTKTETQRARWATRKMSVKGGRSKRVAIMNRMQSRRKRSGNEKNAGNDRQEDADPAAKVTGAEAEAEEETDGKRTVFFNLPLPEEFLDEEGHPAAKYPRNKIRTAKYTALSFIPKNLWYQFHNIANIFFLFLVILVVSGHACCSAVAVRLT